VFIRAAVFPSSYFVIYTNNMNRKWLVSHNSITINRYLEVDTLLFAGDEVNLANSEGELLQHSVSELQNIAKDS
jgi:hypothetical protein